jgi:3-hydroxyacyl-CoA dehydrogenase
MKRVLVVGAGFMGTGIAQVCAQSGYRVHLMDVKEEALVRAMKEIRWSVTKLSDKGILEEGPDAVLQRITRESDLEIASRADWVIESALEIVALKEEIFGALDRLAGPDTPLATNTSSIPITRIARATRRPERVLGIHFFGPVPLMGGVEVIKGEKTAPEVMEKGVSFVRSLGKRPIRVERDIPGFVINRIFSAAFREAVDLVAKGLVSPEDVDAGMKLGYNWNAGPFEIADNAGLDTFVLIGESMRALGETQLVSDAGLIEQMVRDGRRGRKAGKGFYTYTADGKRVPWTPDT